MTVMTRSFGDKYFLNYIKNLKPFDDKLLFYSKISDRNVYGIK